MKISRTGLQYLYGCPAGANVDPRSAYRQSFVRRKPWKFNSCRCPVKSVFNHGSRKAQSSPVIQPCAVLKRMLKEICRCVCDANNAQDRKCAIDDFFHIALAQRTQHSTQRRAYRWRREFAPAAGLGSLWSCSCLPSQRRASARSAQSMIGGAGYKAQRTRRTDRGEYFSSSGQVDRSLSPMLCSRNVRFCPSADLWWQE